MNSEISNQVVDTLFKVLIDGGSKQDYIGENISQLEHSLQAAAQALETSTVFYLFITIINYMIRIYY